TKVSLRELKGLPVELVDVLERAGHKTLQDILDLEREDVDKITDMTPEIADKLMAFLNEMTEEGGDDEAAPGRAGDTTGASEGRAVGVGRADGRADGAGGGAVGDEPGAVGGAGRGRYEGRARAWLGRACGGVSDDEANSRSGGRIRNL